jgi:hypothetical protein
MDAAVHHQAVQHEQICQGAIARSGSGATRLQRRTVPDSICDGEVHRLP